MEADTIFFRYGDRGITRYTTANGKALISDDAQMTLFTADGLFAAAALRAGRVFRRWSRDIAGRSTENSTAARAAAG